MIPIPATAGKKGIPMLTLFTDTDTDITPAVAAEYGYRLISMPYAVDGETVFPYEDERPVDMRAFYDSLRAGVLPTTSGLSSEKSSVMEKR